MLKREAPQLKRRQFITLLGGAARPHGRSRRGRSKPVMPVIGFLSMESPGQFMHIVNAFRRGLSEAGYVEHRNVGIDYSWAEGQFVDPLTRLETGRHARSLQEFGSYRVKRAAWRPP
jgi:hypothetical protein